MVFKKNISFAKYMDRECLLVKNVDKFISDTLVKIENKDLI